MSSTKYKYDEKIWAPLNILDLIALLIILDKSFAAIIKDNRDSGSL